HHWRSRARQRLDGHRPVQDSTRPRGDGGRLARGPQGAQYPGRLHDDKRACAQVDASRHRREGRHRWSRPRLGRKPEKSGR
ncbi:hypothetical protein BN1723_020467, partial [Verticillium longisporum]